MKYVAIVAGVLLIISAGLGYLLKQAYTELGSAQIALDGANAVIKQKEEDHAFSRIQVAKLEGQLEERSKIVQPVRERIIQMPATAACRDSAPIRAAIGGVRDLVCSRSGNKDPGCGSPAALQANPTPPGQR